MSKSMYDHEVDVVVPGHKAGLVHGQPERGAVRHRIRDPNRIDEPRSPVGAVDNLRVECNRNGVRMLF